VRKIYKENLNRPPPLANYSVTIPPGDDDALCRPSSPGIEENGRIIRTHGLDADQTRLP
jgi:D-citramalate synthase